MRKAFYCLKKVALLAQQLFLFISVPSACFAYSSSDDVLTSVLNNAIDYAQSGPARALCVLAVAGAGYLWIGKGVMPKAYAIAIMCGSGFIFGAGFIGTKLLGT